MERLVSSICAANPADYPLRVRGTVILSRTDFLLILLEGFFFHYSILVRRREEAFVVIRCRPENLREVSRRQALRWPSRCWPEAKARWYSWRIPIVDGPSGRWTIHGIDSQAFLLTCILTILVFLHWFFFHGPMQGDGSSLMSDEFRALELRLSIGHQPSTRDRHHAVRIRALFYRSSISSTVTNYNNKYLKF